MLASNKHTPLMPWHQLAELVNAPLLIILSIALGSLLGHASFVSHEWVSKTTDPTILVLVTLLFFSVEFDQVLKAHAHVRFLLIAILANFILVPIIGYSIATLMLKGHPLFMLGLIIYFMSPCTDWFLAFTRLAHGNTLVGSTLLPINMFIQLLLYPALLYLFTQQSVQLQDNLLTGTLVEWFAKPFLIALGLRLALKPLLKPKTFETIINLVSDKAIPLVISLLVVEIFAANITVLFAHSAIFAWMLVGVVSFFVFTFLLSEGLGKVFKLKHPEHALLTMTVAARNAPLMLAVTMIAIPNQPIVYASIVVGMLLEFPHLAMLTFILRIKRAKTRTASARSNANPS